MSPVIFEAQGTEIELHALTKEGAWLKLCELHLGKKEIYELYRFPLLFKVCMTGQEFQSKSQISGEL